MKGVEGPLELRQLTFPPLGFGDVQADAGGRSALRILDEDASDGS